MRLQSVLIATVALALLVEPSIAIAHDIGYPHSDPVPTERDKGNAPSEVIILLGVVMALVTVAALVWLKNHDFGGDDEAAGEKAPTP